MTTGTKIPSNSIGRINIEGEKAEVSFKYNTECFRIISKVPGASYIKEAKKWQLPLIQLPTILDSQHFSHTKFLYDFDAENLKIKLGDLSKRLDEARKRAIANPFSVSSSDIDLLTFDVVIRISADAHWIVIAPGKSMRAKKILKASPLVFFSKRDRAFLTHAGSLNELLKIFRDKEISFAVEAALSERLSKTSKNRSEILTKKHIPTAKELKEALLAPILDLDSSEMLVLFQGATAELKAELVPKKTAGSGKTMSFSIPQALQVLHRAKLKNIPLFLSKNFYDYLTILQSEASLEFNQTFDKFRDELLAILNPDLCWRIDERAFGGLQIAKAIWNNKFSTLFLPIINEFGLTLITSEEFGVFLRAMPIKLPAFFEAASQIIKGMGELVPVSRDFRTLIEILKSRGEILAEQHYFHALKDIELKLSDSEIGTKLYPHQRVAVSWLLKREYGMLGDDMGLGKTLSMLVTFLELSKRGESDFFLVVCPNSLVQNWLRESKQWTPNTQLARLPETKVEREKMLRLIAEGRYTTLDGLVVNFETMRIESVWPLLKEITAARKTVLCIDESQRIKNPQSQSFQAMKEVALGAKRRFLLSGTPTPKDITDIWGQMLILDRGERLGGSYYNWLKTVAELGTKWSEYAVKKFLPDAVEETISRVHEVLLRRKKEDVVNLPEKIFLFRDIELTGDQKKRFNAVRDELRVHVRTLSGAVGTKLIESILEEYLRAVQVASNPRLVDPDWKGEPAKFLELDEIVEDIVKNRGEKMVIWTNYLGNIRELVARYEAYGARPFSGEVSTADRALTIEEFQSNKKDSPRILVAIPAAGGVGITLTAAQTAVYVDRTWNAEHWLQSIDRIHRIGQRGTARIIVLNGSKVDELIGYNLKRKQLQMEKLLASGEVSDLMNLPSIEELMNALS